jgi:hypothetical protein
VKRLQVKAFKEGRSKAELNNFGRRKSTVASSLYIIQTPLAALTVRHHNVTDNKKVS